MNHLIKAVAIEPPMDL